MPGIVTKSLCFDLDGTLIDTAPDLVNTLNKVIAKEGLGPTDYEAARCLIIRWSQAFLRNHLIQRIDQIWSRIDERSIKIKTQ